MAVNLDNKTSKKRNSKAANEPQSVAQASEQAPRYVWWALVALTIAAVTDLVVWRTFSRVGVFIPKDEPQQSGFRTVYQISVQVGTIFLNFAVLMALLALGLMAWRLREQGELNGKGNCFMRLGLAATGLVLLVSLALLYLVENTLFSTLLRLSLIVALGSFALDYWEHYRGGLARTFIGLLAAAYLLPLVAKLLLDLFSLTYLYQPLLEAGELLVTLNGFVLFALYARSQTLASWAKFADLEATNSGKGPRPFYREMLRHWPALLGALVVLGIFLGLAFVTVAESAIVPILGLYALGYTLHWPLPLYAGALFCLAYTIFYNLGQMRRGPLPKAAALGLILIFCGGYLLVISDQYLFALVGVLLLARPGLAQN